MFSEQFIKYIQNKGNYINSNDNTRMFKKYMDKINNKITKINNLIEEYQNKEQNIVEYLQSLEQLKQSKRINNNDIDANTNSGDRPTSITSIRNIKSNENDKDELKFSFQSNAFNSDMNNNNNDNNKSRNIKKNEIKEEELDISDIDVIKKFQEEQDRQNYEKGIIMNKNQKEILLKSLFAEKTIDSNSDKNIFSSANNSKGNDINSIKSITPESSIFINNLLKEKEKEKEKDNKFKDSLIYSIKKKQTYKASLRKSHIDRGSLLDTMLKKNHPENIRKTLMSYSLFSNISEEEGDDEKNNDKNLGDIINDDDKSKGLKYSLSFMDDVDEEDESQFNESSYISRNDTRFISEIKDALKEIKDLKKADKEKENLKQKEKEKEKEKNEEENEHNNNNNNNDLTYNKKSNLKNNKDKNKKNVHFSKFAETDNYKDKDNDSNDNNNLKKENVNNFFIKTKNNPRKVSEDKIKKGNNFIIFEGSDFSFHDENDEENIEKEKGKKALRQDIISKMKKADICEYKNDKKVIKKLDKNIDNKDISINSIDNLRQKIYLFSFKFDKFNCNKINKESISLNENMIENNLKLYYDKKNNSLLLRSNNRIQYNENKASNKNNDLNINNKRESYDLFDNSNIEQNNQNSIVKYNESILNRSNYNLQSEPNVNSNNNSYISNNNNNSIINDNNNYFLYDNNFMTNNEDEDSSFKNTDKKDSVKDHHSIFQA